MSIEMTRNHNSVNSPNESNHHDGKDISKVIGSAGLFQIAVFISQLYLQFVAGMTNLSTPLLVPAVTFTCDDNRTHHQTNGSLRLPATGCFTSDNRRCETFSFDRSIYRYTYTEKLGLVCDSAWLLSFCSTMTFLGDAVACVLFSVISDRYGRRRALLSTILPTTTGALMTLFAPNITVFLLGRFFQGTGGYGGMIVSFVLLMELTGKEHRNLFGGIAHAAFPLGALFAGAMMYCLRNSFQVQICLAGACILMIPAIIFLPESPTWLLQSKHNDKVRMAKDVLYRAAKLNKVEDKYFLNVDPVLSRIMEQVQEHQALSGHLSPLDLFKTRNMRWKTISIAIIWIVMYFVLHAISMNTALFGSDPILTFLLVLSVDIPGVLVITPIVNWRGNKEVSVAALILMIAVLVGSSLARIDEGICLTAVIISCKFLIAGLVISTYNWSTEIFPTIIRSRGMGICCALSRCSALLSPFVKEMSERTGVPAVLGFFAGLLFLTLIWVSILPSNHRLPYPETLKDGENIPIAKPWKIISCGGSSAKLKISAKENGRA